MGALCVCRTAVSDASVLLPDIIQDDRHEPDRDQQEIAEEQGLYRVRMGDPGVDPGHCGDQDFRTEVLDPGPRTGILLRIDLAARFRNRLADEGRDIPER